MCWCEYVCVIRNSQQLYEFLLKQLIDKGKDGILSCGVCSERKIYWKLTFLHLLYPSSSSFSSSSFSSSSSSSSSYCCSSSSSPPLLLPSFLPPSPPSHSSARPNCSYRRPHLSAALLPWLPFLLMTILFGSWLIISPTSVASQDPRLFYLSMGMVFSNISVSLLCSSGHVLVDISMSLLCMY